MKNIQYWVVRMEYDEKGDLISWKQIKQITKGEKKKKNEHILRINKNMIKTQK